jgi:hypothetical protein
MYKLVAPLALPISTSTEPSSVQNLETGAFIPFDPDNTDYQEYLEWLAEGNTPQPAD